MRIVGGSLARRVIAAPPGPETRPTADRVREAVFNVIAHNDWADLDGALVCDAFAGSGALALEALSRGAAHAWLFEKSVPALKTLQQNTAKLGLQEQCTVQRADALRPPRAEKPCSLLFLDPPYRQDLVPLSFAALRAAGWVAPGALVVAEAAANEALAVDGCETLLGRRYGDTAVHFLRAV
ncbi:MAG: 16S rRNA (guanine(966)-N(2))-methyltransferase RsmD [Alphaproteobacteria bacterium]|nr:16S rRNA (guanine(966)-N(2))-methyltransferase RsmD [Alphaproteobacteria bacterium]